MSEFLKNLNDALAGKVYIETPMFIESKHGQIFTHRSTGVIGDLKQFVITPSLVKEGQNIIIERNFIPKTEFTIESIQQLSELISNYSKKIAFVQLILPVVEKVYLERHKNILGRYLEEYLIASDEIGKRWDFLIQKLD